MLKFFRCLFLSMLLALQASAAAVWSAEQKGLKALIIMAVPEIGKNLAKATSDIAAIEAPVLLLVEAGDEPDFQKNFDALDQALRANNKEVKSIRYDRGGGHNLFHSVGYYMTDVKAFLKDKLSAR